MTWGWLEFLSVSLSNGQKKGKELFSPMHSKGKPYLFTLPLIELDLGTYEQP